MSAGVSLSLRRIVISRAQGLCEYCLIHQSDAAFTFQVDHPQFWSHPPILDRIQRILDCPQNAPCPTKPL